MQIFRVPLHPNAPFYLALRKVFGLGTATSLSVAEVSAAAREGRASAGWVAGHDNLARVFLCPTLASAKPPLHKSHSVILTLVPSYRILTRPAVSARTSR